MTEIDTQAAPAPLQVRVKDQEALAAVAAFLLLRDESITPEEADDAERMDSAIAIVNEYRAALDLSAPPQIAALEAEIVKLRGELGATVRKINADNPEQFWDRISTLRGRAERAEAEVARLTEALEAEQATRHYVAKMLATGGILTGRLAEALTLIRDHTAPAGGPLHDFLTAALKESTNAQA